MYADKDLNKGSSRKCGTGVANIIPTHKRYNSDALRILAATDFTGASLSNYGEPLFELWNDVDWHLASNTYFLTMAGATGIAGDASNNVFNVGTRSAKISEFGTDGTPLSGPGFTTSSPATALSIDPK